MKGINNQLKIGVILSYFHIGLNMIIQLTYTPLMIRLLGKSEYGLYNLVGSVVSYLSLFSLGFSGAYLRFSTLKRKEGNSKIIGNFNGMFLSLFLALGMLSLVCGSILTFYSDYIFGKKLTEQELNTAKILMLILVMNVALSFPSSAFNSMIIGEEKFIFQRLISIIATFINPLIVLPLLIMGKGSVAIVLVTTLLTFANLLLSIYYCLWKLHIPIYFKDFEWHLLREMWVFSIFIFLNMVIDQINWTVDKLVLGRIIGTKGVAEYGVGSQINTIIISFSTAISSVFSPLINKIAVNSSNREKDFSDLFINVGRIQFEVIFLLISGFTFFGRYFIERIYAGSSYTQSYYVALLLIIPELVPLIQNLGIEIQRAINKHQFRSIMYFIMAVINVLMSIPLARVFGIVGAALGTCISLVVMNIIVMNFYYEKRIGLDILSFWKNILQLFASASPALILGFILQFITKQMSFYGYITLIIFYSIVYSGLMYKFGMNHNERMYIQNIIAKIKRILSFPNNANLE